MNVGYWSKSISWKYFIFHEMTLKLYFMKCPERKISQCILHFRVCIYIQYLYTIFLWCSEKENRNNEHLLELIKGRSKVQEKNMSRGCALNFNQWKAHSENYKPMKAWLWLVYKFIESYCELATILCVHSNSK